jgi:hypothetical protein
MSQNSRNKDFFLLFSLYDGSAFGSVTPTGGSGKPKNLWIWLWIRKTRKNVNDLHCIVTPLTATPFQMQEVPEDFFVDIVSRNNFLVTSLTDLFEDIRAVDGIDPRLRKRAENFENYLR